MTEPRRTNPEHIALPEGYRIEAIAEKLTFPTGITFDPSGGIYVIEAGYSYGEKWTTPRLLRLRPQAPPEVVAVGRTNGPWTGVFFHRGDFYVAEGGTLEGGRILRITPEGQIQALVQDLPGRGDHHTNGPILGPDGWLYFGQGTASNSAIVGLDNAKFGWLRRFPYFHDIPGEDIILTGENFATKNPFDGNAKNKVITGAFSPFGKATRPGQVIPGKIPCSGSVMRIRPEGGPLELVAWGFRNPFGLAFSPDGKLYVTDNSYDDRGSRPVWGTPDVMWEVTPGTWYGWPDFSAGQPLTQKMFKPPGKSQPKFLLASHPNKPPKPAARFAVHASADGFDFCRNPQFGFPGEAFVALLGDEAPATGKVLNPVGNKVVRVNPATGVITEFAVNKGKHNAPASKLKSGGLERPVAARFDPEGTALYVVDFGVLLHDQKGAIPVPNTGVIWRITPQRARP